MRSLQGASASPERSWCRGVGVGDAILIPPRFIKTHCSHTVLISRSCMLQYRYYCKPFMDKHLCPSLKWMSSCGNGNTICSCFNFSSISINNEFRKCIKYSTLVHAISVNSILEVENVFQRIEGAGSAITNALFFATSKRTVCSFRKSVPYATLNSVFTRPIRKL